MIREATKEDIPQILVWGQHFADAAGIDWFSPETFDKIAQGMIATDDHCLLVSDTGMIGGCHAAHFLNIEKTYVQELFWWAERDGKAVMEGLEMWARSKGADMVMMSSLEALRPAALDRVLKARGYTPSDHYYLKEL